MESTGKRVKFLNDVLKTVVVEKDLAKRNFNAQTALMMFFSDRTIEELNTRGVRRLQMKISDMVKTEDVYDRKCKWRRLVKYFGFQDENQVL